MVTQYALPTATFDSALSQLNHIPFADALRNGFDVVPQETALTSSTTNDNLTLTKPPVNFKPSVWNWN